VRLGGGHASSRAARPARRRRAQWRR
jgi:hypothetical protein